MNTAPTKETSFSRRDFIRTGGIGAAAFGISNLCFEMEAPALCATPTKPFNIKRIDRVTVKLPYRETSGRNMARELPHWAWSEIFEVELESGDVGFGETLLYYTWEASTDEDVKRARGQNAVELMWDDSLGAGLQMALFDVVAKAVRAPIHALLGTKVHDKTPLSWWNIDTSAEDMVAECREAYRQGYRSYKTKGRPWFDVWEQVEAASRAVPESFHLAIDFNDTLLDAKRAIPILKDLAKYPQVAIYETPIFQSDIEGNQAIRRATRVPVAMHYGKPPAKVAIKQEVCDGFVIGGGASRLMRRGRVVEMAEMPFWLQLVGTGITAAWSMHFGGVLSQAVWPAVNCHQLYEHTLLTEPIRVEDGFASVPDKPGLGYELDHALIAKLRVAKPKRRPDPPRVIETVWPDGRKMFIANSGEVNFMLDAAREGKTPYFERGVQTRLVPNDGSPQWRELYEKARKAPVQVR